MDTTQYSVATFAGGCFWCMQPPFDKTSGVIKTMVGYTGGNVANPTYAEVSDGHTGHYEAIRVVYDATVVSYAQLLDIFWTNIDPTDAYGQFADKGAQYLTAIFYHNDQQKAAADQSKNRMAASGKFNRPIVTRILPAGDFYEAEDYHQQYYQKNAQHYQRYKIGSGRDGFIRKMWTDKQK
jgi:methionine-S-sulfoxide reductase